MNYRLILRNELEKRCQRNTKYSLRAFARDLGIQSSRLSEILSGKQGLSREMAGKISKKLAFSHSEKEYFCDLVESLHSRSPASRELARLKLENRRQQSAIEQMRLDVYEVIANWYHAAILELMQLKDFKSETKWIASKIGISSQEVEQALQRLARVGSIEYIEGKWRSKAPVVSTPDDIPSHAIREFHSQISVKASASLYSDPVEFRDFSSVIVSLKKERFEEFKNYIRQFRAGFTKKADELPDRDSLYCFSMQFFELTR